MSFSDFDLKTAVEKFGLVEERDRDLFGMVEPIEPSPTMRDWLDEFTPIALGISTEKARSEYIIAPVLFEARRRSKPPMNVLPGVALDVDRPNGLSGFCDFLIARSAEYFYLRAPLVAVVEAKREDIIAGLGQCVAEMVAIRMFNERESKPTRIVYGCVTSGSAWRFLKLEGSTIAVDRPEYHIRDPAKILGILVHISAG